MSEGSGIGAERPFELGELKSNPETAWPLVDDVGSIHLFGGDRLESVRANDADAVDRAAICERSI